MSLSAATIFDLHGCPLAALSLTMLAPLLILFGL
jgi:hypothetical protein